MSLSRAIYEEVSLAHMAREARPGVCHSDGYPHLHLQDLILSISPCELTGSTMSGTVSYVDHMHSPEAIPISIVVTTQELPPSLIISQDFQRLIDVSQQIIRIFRH